VGAGQHPGRGSMGRSPPGTSAFDDLGTQFHGSKAGQLLGIGSRGQSHPGAPAF
jgi:hypothetical protein